jgi:putative tryptophan/tyrosine transport system substrate-binding protein
MPLIGMFINLAEDDPEVSTRRDAFLQGLGSFNDLHVAMRFGGGKYRKNDTDTADTNYLDIAGQLANLTPDLYICTCWPTLRSLLTVRDPNTPIVFAGLVDLTMDPTGSGGHFNIPDNNLYGFVDYGTNLCDQWSGYLTMIAPIVKRAAVVYNANDNRPGQGQDFAYNEIVKNAGPLTPYKIDVRSKTLADDIKAFASCTGPFAAPGLPCTPGGLIVPAGSPTAAVRKTIIQAAKDNKLPAVYANRIYAFDGGLLSRGPNSSTLYLYAGHYANQILNKTPPTTNKIDISQTGDKPIFETVINLDTAAAINLTVNPTLLKAADVIIGRG